MGSRDKPAVGSFRTGTIIGARHRMIGCRRDRSLRHSAYRDGEITGGTHPFPALLERGGIMVQTARDLPHVTPSPRVPAAALCRNSDPLFSDSILRSRDVDVPATLMHPLRITPSPSLTDLLDGRSRTMNTFKHDPLRDGSVRASVMFLPHVTPSPESTCSH